MPSAQEEKLETGSNDRSRSPRPLNRGRGQLKLAISRFSSRTITSQHESVRDFLKSSDSTNSSDALRSSIGSSALRTSIQSSAAEAAQIYGQIPSSPIKRKPSSIPVATLRERLNSKCEESRRHNKLNREISLHWGSLQFSLLEDAEYGCNDMKRISEALNESNSRVSMNFDASTAPRLSDYSTMTSTSSLQSNNSLQAYASPRVSLMDAPLGLTEIPESASSRSLEEEIPEAERKMPAIETEHEASDNNTETTAEESTIEVAPGIHMPLKTPLATWQAVEEGQVTVTTCNHCKVELTCTDDAHLVMCADCWVFSPVDQGKLNANGEIDYADMKNGCVSVGIQTEEIFEWLAIQEASAMLGG